MQHCTKINALTCRQVIDYGDRLSLWLAADPLCQEIWKVRE